MFPSLRLGYVVVPPDLVDAFTAARTLMERHGPSVEQSVLTEFITEGHFGRHIRRMRALYAERQEILVDAVRHDLKGLLEVEPAEGDCTFWAGCPRVWTIALRPLSRASIA